MIASMYSAVAGLSAHQTKMDVIGNNVANVNTYGFKSSRVCFSDVFYQNFAGASAPTATKGGTNASQKGYGSAVAGINIITARGGSASTDRSLDVYINGDGYLPVKDANENILYTRLGSLFFDVQGNLVDGNGYKIMGLPMNGENLGIDPAVGTAEASELEAIKVTPEDYKKLTNISIGDTGQITAIKEDSTVTTLGYLALATFINVDGLSQEGQGYYTVSSNSGEAIAVVPGSKGTGSIVTSALEMSNVDLASEFTEMIFAQRGFQANSRVITTSDTLLEELVNLVR